MEGSMPEQRDFWLSTIKEVLAAHQIPLESPDILVILSRLLASLECELGESLESGVIAALVLHLLFSRTGTRAIHVKPEARSYLHRQFPYEFMCCAHAIHVANQHLLLPIPLDEAYNLLGIFKRIDIFLTIGEACPSPR
jgi:hypothetical protein